jgi:uncharacterized membrane protein
MNLIGLKWNEIPLTLNKINIHNTSCVLTCESILLICIHQTQRGWITWRRRSMKGLRVPEMVENLYRCRYLSSGMWHHDAGLLYVSVLVPWTKSSTFYRTQREGISFIRNVSVYQSTHSNHTPNLHSYHCESLWSTQHSVRNTASLKTGEKNATKRDFT